MDNKTTLVLVLALLATACGDSVPPPSRGTCSGFQCSNDGHAGAGGNGGAGGQGGDGGQGGVGGRGGAGGEAGGCLDDVDCEVDEVCIPGEYDGVNIPGDVTDTPGVCATLPPQMELSVVTFTPMRFEDEGGQRDPDKDAFVVEQGVFDVTSSYATFGFAEGPTPWGPWELPYRSPPLGFYFYWQAELSLRVDGIECNLVFGPDGQVVAGGVVLEAGKLLCSNNNWLPPQYPDAPGLSVEYVTRPVF